MAVTIITKQHDDKITFTDVPKIDGEVVPPTSFAGCSVKFILRIQGSPIAEVSQPATIEGDGTFSYRPIPADVAQIGKFRMEWEVLYPDNKRLTFPNGGYNVVKIIEDLG
jgi:hypothetical protein